VVGFKRLTPFLLEGSDLTQEIYCSTFISNIASVLERSIAMPVIKINGRTHGSNVTARKSLWDDSSGAR